MPQTILTRVVNYKLDVVQLHGDESPVMIDNLRCTLDPDIRPGIEIMKTISIGEASDFAKCEPYIGHVDYFLFDTKCDGKGGSGRQFDWQMLSNYKFDVPFILSGGIGPDDAARIKALNHPQLLGVDVNSRFETEPAMKDAALVKRFIAELK
jgi:phosphoribosylanthranilate isomerase